MWSLLSQLISIRLVIEVDHTLREHCRIAYLKHGGFTLRKWNSSNPLILREVPNELKDTQVQCLIPWVYIYQNSWYCVEYSARPLQVNYLRNASSSYNDKGSLISDVSKIFDVFGWFAPCTVKMKIQFQTIMGTQAKLG